MTNERLLTRAKAQRGKNWLTGFLICVHGEWYIHHKDYSPRVKKEIERRDLVDINTAGQFTGFQDTTQNPIYEGDIIKYINGLTNMTGEICFGTYSKNDSELSSNYGFYIKWINKTDNSVYKSDFLLWASRVTVIGNKWDNSELMANSN